MIHKQTPSGYDDNDIIEFVKSRTAKAKWVRRKGKIKREDGGHIEDVKGKEWGGAAAEEGEE